MGESARPWGALRSKDGAQYIMAVAGGVGSCELDVAGGELYWCISFAA